MIYLIIFVVVLIGARFFISILKGDNRNAEKRRTAMNDNTSSNYYLYDNDPYNSTNCDTNDNNCDSSDDCGCDCDCGSGDD